MSAHSNRPIWSVDRMSMIPISWSALGPAGSSLSSCTIPSNRIADFGICLESRFAKPCYRDILRVILVSMPSLFKTDASYIVAVLIPIELCASSRYSGLQYMQLAPCSVHEV
jgi:hypothetical protein